MESEPLLECTGDLVRQCLTNVCVSLKSVSRREGADAHDLTGRIEDEVLDAQFRLLVDWPQSAIQLDEEPRPLVLVPLRAGRLDPRLHELTPRRDTAPRPSGPRQV